MRKGQGSAYDKWNIFVVICDHKPYEAMTSTQPWGTLGSVASLLVATLYQGNLGRNHKLWNIASTERYILHMQVLLECCYILMESSQWENWNHLFCRKVSFLTAPHCQFRSVGQGMKQICLYLWYPLFQLNGIDAINEITKPRII
jgi:hypothetical protein